MAHPKKGEGGSGNPTKSKLKKKKDFVNMISNVLHYLVSSRNKLLKSGDD